MEPSVRDARFQIALPAEGLRDFCRRWPIAELALFGSVLRSDFRPDSDVDVLVTFRQDAALDLGDWLAMRDELSRLFGREVDLVDRRSVERSVNWYRRREILRTAERIHVA